MRNRDLAQARSMLEEATAKWPSDIRFARPMALVYATFGQGQQAVRSLERHLAAHKDDVESLLMGVEWIYQLRVAGVAAHRPPKIGSWRRATPTPTRKPRVRRRRSSGSGWNFSRRSSLSRVMSNRDADVTRLFLEASRRKLVEEYWPRMRSSVESLTDEQVWWRPNEASNSIGNLLLHLNGNVGQWLVGAFNAREDDRNRPAEFAQRKEMPRATLVATLDATLQEAAATISRLTDADLLRTCHVQGYTVSGVEVVYHVVEHFGMHYGQILYITKLLRGQDLGFYRALDKTGRLP